MFPQAQQSPMAQMAQAGQPSGWPQRTFTPNIGQGITPDMRQIGPNTYTHPYPNSFGGTPPGGMGGALPSAPNPTYTPTPGERMAFPDDQPADISRTPLPGAPPGYFQPGPDVRQPQTMRNRYHVPNIPYNQPMPSPRTPAQPPIARPNMKPKPKPPVAAPRRPAPNPLNIQPAGRPGPGKGDYGR